MKNLLILLGVFSFLLILNSCSNDETKEEIKDEVIEETFTDDANAEVTAADTSSTGVYQEEVDENAENSLQDALKNNNKSEEVEEGGMSLCDCVKKNQELDDIMMSDKTSDADFDKALAEKEALKTGDCKILFNDKQNTMEEKKAHERKVKNCLRK